MAPSPHSLLTTLLRAPRSPDSSLHLPLPLAGFHHPPPRLLLPRLRPLPPPCRSRRSLPSPPSPHAPSPLNLWSSPPSPIPEAPPTSALARFATRFQRRSTTSAPDPSPTLTPAPLPLPPTAPDAPRRPRTAASPTHVPPHITLAPHSAFLHEPRHPSQVITAPAPLPPLDTPAILCRLSTGDVVLAMEVVAMAASDTAHVWLEAAVKAPGEGEGVGGVTWGDGGARLRDFVAGHRGLRVPAAEPRAGALLAVKEGLRVKGRGVGVGEGVRVGVEVACEGVGGEGVEVEGVELSLPGTRWRMRGRQGKGEVTVPLPLSSHFLASRHHIPLPLPLPPLARHHFLFTLDPLPSLPAVLAHCQRQVVAALLHHPALGASYGQAVRGYLLTPVVVRWRHPGASTPLISQVEVRWELPVTVHLRGGEGGEGVGRVSPALTLAYPPSVRLYQMFTVSATVSNPFTLPLTFTLHVAHNEADVLVAVASAASSGSGTPAEVRLPPLSVQTRGQSVGAGLVGWSPPFSPVAGYYFPFPALKGGVRVGVVGEGQGHVRGFSAQSFASGRSEGEGWGEGKEEEADGGAAVSGECGGGRPAACGRDRGRCRCSGWR